MNLHCLPLTLVAMTMALSSSFGQHLALELPVGYNGSQRTVHFFSFDSRKHDILIIDQEGISKQKYANLRVAMAKRNCIAGCNGASATASGSHEGLAVCDGKVISNTFSTANEQCAILATNGTNVRLEPSKEYLQSPLKNPEQLLQSGPLLISDGKTSAKLNAHSYKRRTFIIHDGGNKWAIAYSPACTLKTLAYTLSNHAKIPFKVETAVVLGEGSASGFWTKSQLAQPLYLRELRRSRSFIGIAEK